MTLLRFIAWIIMIAALWLCLQLAQKRLRKKAGAWVFALLFVLKVTAAVALAFCSMAVKNSMIWKSGYFPVALYAALLCDGAADLAALISGILSKNRLKAGTLMVISAVLLAAYTCYGTVNMQIITPREHSFTSDKLKNEYNFVFLADLHYGSAQSEKTADKALDEIAELDPDFVLLGGDITDEMTTKEEMQRVYKKLGSLGVPVFFFYGNHDRQDHGHYVGGAKYTPEELREAIESNGIKILRDDIYQWSDDLVILGREDESAGDARCEVKDLPERPDDAYVLCVDHSPYQEDDIQETGADLQLSGHVHAGQFFPLRTVYRLGVNNIYGYYKAGDTDLYVSSGITGWYYPFRTEAHCNYEVVKLKPAE